MVIRIDHVRITSNTPSLGTHRVEIGDTDISNAVCGVGIVLHPGELPDVRLNLLLQQDSAQPVDGPATVSLPDDTHAALVALGWKSPAAAAPEPTEEQRHAERIILSHTEDIDFGSIGEQLEDATKDMTDEEADDLCSRVDFWASNATVTVSWPAADTPEGETR